MSYLQKKMRFNIKRFARQIQQIDDKLGSFVDYEGDVNGPTHIMYRAGKDAWERRCLQAAELHEQVARLWREALTASREKE